MYFDATPMNMTILLVVSLAIIAIVLLMKGRYDSNLPLLYFSAALAVHVLSDRVLSPYLLYSGIAFALILRFEFMGKGFTKFSAIFDVFSDFTEDLAEIRAARALRQSV